MPLVMAVPAPVFAMGGEGDAHIAHKDKDSEDDEIFESTRNSLLKLSSVLKRKRSLSLSDCGGPSNKFPDIEDTNDNIMKDDSCGCTSGAQGERVASDSHADDDDNMDSDDGPRRPMLDCYQPKMYGEKKRDFQKQWFSKHRWLGYNQQSATGYCYPCQKYTKSSFRFSDWKHSEYLNQHSATHNHITAMMKWNDNLEAVEKNKSILTQLDSHHAAEVKENRNHIKIIFETVAFLGKQNIPFRGHKEDRSNLTELSDINRGNFLEILNLQSTHSPFLRERLKMITKNKRHGQWTSHMIQNEIISLLADFTRKEIVEEINNDKTGDVVIGVISDETSDITRHEQISLVISYIDKLGNKCESFLGFIQTEKTDGAHLYKLISEEMKKIGLSLFTVVGLGFDGAGNMAGVNKVVVI